MILSAFPGTFTGAPELLLNITPILRNFLLAEASARGHTELLLVGSGMSNPNWFLWEKQKSHVDVCNEARKFLPLLQNAS